jgi:transposase-like protein
MKTSKMPPVEELRPYKNNRKLAAEKYGVCEKTVIRWMQKAGLYQAFPRLSFEKAEEVRRHYEEGKTMKELAAQYGVTFSTISRIIHKITYHKEKEVADVSVIYNPDPISSAVFFPSELSDGTP